MAAVLAFKQAAEPRREVRLCGGHDYLLNNTSKPLVLEDVSGRVVETLEPGKMFQPGSTMAVYFKPDCKFNFRSYVNEETPDEFTY